MRKKQLQLRYWQNHTVCDDLRKRAMAYSFVRFRGQRDIGVQWTVQLSKLLNSDPVQKTGISLPILKYVTFIGR